MKKSILMVFLATGLAYLPAFFTSVNATQTKNVFLQDPLTFVEIEIKDLPEEIATSVANDYTDSIIKSAASADSATGKKVYKLTLGISGGEESIVYYNADGSKYEE